MKPFRHGMILGMVFLSALVSCQRRAGLSSLLVEEGKISSADGVPIHYKLYGKGDVSLVFVHDWCTNMSYWDEQIPSFGVNYTVVTLDLAGHGKSGQDRTTWTMEAFGQDIAAVVEQLDLNNVVLIGHGMGGLAIMEAAKLSSDCAIGLVGADSFTDLYMKALNEEQIELSLQPWRKDYQLQMREFARLTYFSPKSDHDVMKEIIFDMVKTPPEVALGALEELLRYDGAGPLREVRLSVRCIQTDHISSTFEITETNAKSVWVDYMEGLGHFIMLEDPLAFNRFLAGYVSEFVMESYQR
ncbi:MAG: alpha/beta hydrolase [Candidatus Aminicenantes bacterium]|nr:alpha/beta hydrolase [Candidatus Aminicenantes bacterium]MDH5384614.1 alpha/beta hydrolase [Candidatus Aminicenantes bacterium]MDH5744675.1 alpha/beta hydrolase [Candidatus Aminicenantes bacterium]